MIVMDEGKRLADPNFEPTDDDFGRPLEAGVRFAAREASLRKIREEIAAAPQSALERLQTKWPAFNAPVPSG